MAEDEQAGGDGGSGGGTRTGSQTVADRPGGDGSTEGGGSIRSLLASVGGLSRRQVVLRGTALLAVFGILLLVALVPVGLLGLTVNDRAVFEGAPAAPANATVAETGYELRTADEITVERDIDAGGQDRTIAVVNQRHTYERTVEVQNRSYNAGVFAALSTPAISVAGTPQNPVAEMSDRELLQRFSDQLTDGTESLEFERVGTREATMLGRSTDVGEFRTNVTVGGEPQEVAVYVTRVRSEGDIVVAAGVHPTAFPGDRVSIFRLIHAVEHPSG